MVPIDLMAQLSAMRLQLTLKAAAPHLMKTM
jgi:hypothetical protein